MGWISFLVFRPCDWGAPPRGLVLSKLPPFPPTDMFLHWGAEQADLQTQVPKARAQKRAVLVQEPEGKVQKIECPAPKPSLGCFFIFGGSCRLHLRLNVSSWVQDTTIKPTYLENHHWTTFAQRTVTKRFLKTLILGMEYESLGIFLVKIGPDSILTLRKFY